MWPSASAAVASCSCLLMANPLLVSCRPVLLCLAGTPSCFQLLVQRNMPGLRITCLPLCLIDLVRHERLLLHGALRGTSHIRFILPLLLLACTALYTSLLVLSSTLCLVTDGFTPTKTLESKKEVPVKLPHGLHGRGRWPMRSFEVECKNLESDAAKPSSKLCMCNTLPKTNQLSNFDQSSGRNVRIRERDMP